MNKKLACLQGVSAVRGAEAHPHRRPRRQEKQGPGSIREASQSREGWEQEPGQGTVAVVQGRVTSAGKEMTWVEIPPIWARRSWESVG